MKRAIITPPDLGGALAELKHWLAITNPQDDASLEALLRAALATCEAFVGAMPIITTVEETFRASDAWHLLSTKPVLAITQVEAISDEGDRYALQVDNYEIDIDANAHGRVRLLEAIDGTRLAVGFTSGLAHSWETMPDGLRHGVLRLAAHHYRSRDLSDEASPPAAVAALWRPWRRMRLT